MSTGGLPEVDSKKPLEAGATIVPASKSRGGARRPKRYVHRPDSRHPATDRLGELTDLRQPSLGQRASVEDDLEPYGCRMPRAPRGATPRRLLGPRVRPYRARG